MPGIVEPLPPTLVSPPSPTGEDQLNAQTALVAEVSTPEPLLLLPVFPLEVSRAKESSLVQAWSHAQRWQTRMHLLFIVASSLAACFGGRLTVVHG